ncbi:unnamed protein product [Gongylonema pulchrum]|uniref:Lactamase_B domain-containing protein n=1 Tax=Gongylonema pulchrum TaxID=637853 RepID=A0A183D5L9_9BILA|nr:unnamed protein product [Gongylonema pulchrum]
MKQKKGNSLGEKRQIFSLEACCYPCFIGGGGSLTGLLDCVIITHFHLDHCGALPHMSEVVGYDGPIYMTYPTKAIAPVLLEDFRKVQTEYKGDTNFFTSQMIKNCMKKVRFCKGISFFSCLL